MGSKQFSGVYAAVLTPRRADDSVDAAGLTSLIEFLLSKGISSFALNGATGEFCLTTPKQLQIVLATVRKATQGKSQILCGVGAPGTALAKELAAIAQDGGTDGLLLPMPYFFRYQQVDLAAFCCEVANSTDLPVLLYNLPQFSTGIEKETVCRLISETPNIVGIKDSGGSLDILRDLTEHGIHACRLVGHDPTLRPAMSEGVCDGVVSGIACVLPELILALYGQGRRAASAEFDDAWRCLWDVVRRLDACPTPWGLKWIAEARGIIPASFSQPLAEARASQAAQIKAWLEEWFPSAVKNGAPAAY